MPKVKLGGKEFTIHSNVFIADEINDIENPFIFDEDEIVLCAVAGRVKNERKGILICTTKSLYYYDKGHIFGPGLKFPARSVDALSVKKKLLAGSSLYMECGALLYHLHDIPRSAAQEMYTTIKNEHKRSLVEMQGEED